jgi:pyrrolidone-carboxylate peptidase
MVLSGIWRDHGLYSTSCGSVVCNFVLYLIADVERAQSYVVGVSHMTVRTWIDLLAMVI